MALALVDCVLTLACSYLVVSGIGRPLVMQTGIRARKWSTEEQVQFTSVWSGLGIPAVRSWGGVFYLVVPNGHRPLGI